MFHFIERMGGSIPPARIRGNYELRIASLWFLQVKQVNRFNTMTDTNNMQGALTKSQKNAELGNNLEALSTEIQRAWMVQGNFTRAIAYGMAVANLREALDEKVMKALLKLKNSKLGFRTDEVMNQPYPMQLVRDCIIDAATLGLQCVGNQFNIIGGNMYVTKEGFTFLLRQLSQQGALRDMKFIYHPAEISESSTMGTARNGEQYQKVEREGRVMVEVSCVYQGKAISEQLEFVIRVNKGMSQDAVLGKAERKAKAWLYNYLTDQAISDGEAAEGFTNDDLRFTNSGQMRDVTPKNVVKPSFLADDVTDEIPGLGGATTDVVVPTFEETVPTFGQLI